MGIIEELDKEIESIELRIKPELEKISTLRATRQIFYEKIGTDSNNLASLIQSTKTLTQGRKESVAGRVIPFVEGILADGVRRKTLELLPLVAQEGIEIGGEDKLTGLSAILSRKKDIFVGDKKLGWTLAKFLNDTCEDLV